MVRGLMSVCVAAPALVLFGCGGGGEDESTTTTTTTTSEELPKDHACYDDGQVITDGHCCCLTCVGDDSNTMNFSVITEEQCLDDGGQCKTQGTSTFQRPPAAKHATEFCLKNGENDLQKHLIGGSPTKVQVVWIGQDLSPTIQLKESGSSKDAITVNGSTRTYSIFQHPTGWYGYEGSDRGDEYDDCYLPWGADYTNSTCYYTSDPIHRVDLTGLQAGTEYMYQVDGEAGDKWTIFKTPPAIGSPITFGLVADLGQTTDSMLTMEHMLKFVNDGIIQNVIFPGDLSYADGAADYWDSYGRLGDSLWGSMPTSYGVGNHEFTSGAENFQSFLPRYSWPVDEEDSHDYLWFSYNAGMAHVIMLCSYCDTTEDSQQLKWFKEDLLSVDRSQTPWIIAAFHAPWYTSSLAHPMSESEVMRKSFEDSVYKQVDFIVMGHVHAYERTVGVYKNETDQCGPVYITIGDGGNQEGPACGWVMGLPWSKKKEFSFGFGTLSIMTETTANWSWYRNQDDLVQHDTVLLTRPSSIEDCKDSAGVAV